MKMPKTDKKQNVQNTQNTSSASDTRDANSVDDSQTLNDLDQSSPALAAYMRNLKAISDKIDTSETTASVTAQHSYALQDQTPEMIEMLRREAADHIALHIALEDHLMEQMTTTQATLQDTIATYVDILTELDNIDNKNNKNGGPSCH